MQPHNSEEQAVRQFLIEVAAAVQRQDGTALARMWADEYAFITPLGVVINKSQRLQAVTAPNTRFDVVGRDQEDLRLYGDTAVEIARTTLQGQVNGQAANQQYRAITVVVKQAGQWQMVAQQLNVIPQPPQ